MTPVVYLHVGAPKSGTTYLQNVMWHNRPVLSEQGVLYPGDDPTAHVWAAFDLRGTFFDGHRDPVTIDAWPRLVDEVRRWDGRAALISQELLASAFPDHVERALADLDFAEVHLVYTARDLARQIPAHWQEDVKNRAALTFGEFVTGLRDPDAARSPWVREFWRMQDAAAVLERWSPGVPPGRVHVVTLPPPGAPDGLLLERFCALIGVDPGGLDTSQAFGNPSLGIAETELVRRINLAARDTVDWPVHDVYVKHDLAQERLTARAGATRIRLPDAYRPWVLERSRELATALADAGYGVSGDLGDLIPAFAGALAPADPDEVAEAEVLDAALDAVVTLLGHCADERREDAGGVSTDELLEQVARLRADTARLVELSTPPSPVKDVVRDLSERHRLVMRARETYWRLAEARRTHEAEK